MYPAVNVLSTVTMVACDAPLRPRMAVVRHESKDFETVFIWVFDFGMFQENHTSSSEGMSREHGFHLKAAENHGA
jgi:hypothetical protein